MQSSSNKINNINIKNLCGYCEITVIYALLKHCRLFIGNDSGLMPYLRQLILRH